MGNKNFIGLHPNLINIDSFIEITRPISLSTLLHLSGAMKILAIIDEFKELGVQNAGPSHCTGERAIGLFRQAYQENFIEMGVGKVIIIDE